LTLNLRSSCPHELSPTMTKLSEQTVRAKLALAAKHNMKQARVDDVKVAGMLRESALV